jgi:hypothetical protein
MSRSGAMTPNPPFKRTQFDAASPPPAGPLYFSHL